MKLCQKCKTEKADENFARNKTQPDGLQRWCRDCFKDSARARRNRKAEPAT